LTKPKLLLIGPYPESDMTALEKDFVVLRLWEAKDPDLFLAAHSDIRAIGTRGDLTTPARLVNALPALEIVACYGVGVDGIDLSATRPRGIKVTNTPDVLTDDVADLALGLMLGIARQMPQGDTYVRSGQWQGAPMALGRKMSGMRLGVVGLGRIGLAIAQRAEAFNMRVSYFGRSSKAGCAYTYVPSIVDLASRSDYLVVALAGGPSTKAIINADVLQALGPGGYFINVARGTVVDEDALLAALENRTILGAGLDVFLNEPMINPRFVKLDNVVLQPHVGSATVETRFAMGKLVRDNLAAHFAGGPLLTPVA
jgi:lactate dehydrogenase-like 2-hydroxyacid dehydrogenase